MHVTTKGEPAVGRSAFLLGVGGGFVVSDGELICRAARGERGAFEEFYRRTSPWLAVRLFRRCGDEQVVAEVMQETYLAVWRAAGAFAGSEVDDSAVGWLWTIAARRLIDVFRRRGRQSRSVSAVVGAVIAPSAEEEVLARVVGGEVGDALRRLAPELRQVLQAMALDGLSVRETSLLLGVPKGTVKTRVRRARIAMREAMS